MKAWKFYVPMIALAGIGFAIVKAMTSKDDKSNDGVKRYHAISYPGEGGQWYARVMEDGKPTKVLGPLPTKEDADRQAAAFLAGIDVVYFYTLHSEETAPGKYNWYFNGWSRGELVSPDNGPFATETVAVTAATNWTDEQQSVVTA